MSLSRQDNRITTTGRTNQKARTRAALLQAATELVREGQAPSIPDAAARALVSVPTAYRYFASAEDLWWEASTAAVALQPVMAEANAAIENAGTDPLRRLDACLRSVGFHMLDDQVPYRRLAKTALDQWFRQAGRPGAEKLPVREGRRGRYISKVLEPLRNTLRTKDLDRVARALGVVIGTDAMLALTDGMGLDVPRAKAALLDAGRWLLAGALSELEQEPAPDTGARGRSRRR